MYTYYDPYTTLSHFGIKGQKWGIRRYQNEDGTLTSAGRRRYKRGEVMDASNKNDSDVTRTVKNDYNKLSDSEFLSKYKIKKDVYRKRVNKYGDPFMNRLVDMALSNNKKNDELIDAIKKSWYDKDTKKEEIRKLNETKLNTIAITDSYARGRAETNKLLSKLHKKYTVVYDVTTGYSLRDKEK